MSTIASAGLTESIQRVINARFALVRRDQGNNVSSHFERRAEKAGANSDAAKLHHSFRSCGGSVFGIPKRSSETAPPVKPRRNMLDVFSESMPKHVCNS